MTRRCLPQLVALAVLTTNAAMSTAIAAQEAAPATNTTGSEVTKGQGIERVVGIGGVFFRAHDPKALARWYDEHLGVTIAPTSLTDSVWQQEAGPTVFAPFPETTGYFGDPHKDWMLNFRVRSLDRMVAQLRASGIEVRVDTAHYPNGRFAHLQDPEGNPLELWQPAAAPTLH
jgi:glyoxylase I family protein